MGAPEQSLVIHQVGSYPAENAETAMREMLDVVGPYMRTLPDGETGLRAGYMIGLAEILAENTDAVELIAGDWSTVESRSQLELKRPLSSDDLHLPYAAYALSSRAIHQAIVREYNRDLPLQVSIPTATTTEFITIGPKKRPSPTDLLNPTTFQTLRRLRQNYPAFSLATAEEILNVIEYMPPDEVVFQLEATAEMSLALRSPNFLRRRMVRSLGRRIAGLTTLAPAGTRFGVHLCTGSFQNRSERKMKTAAPMVALANAVVEAWPKNQTLEYLHGPLASSDEPAPAEEDFYKPLTELELPTNVPFYAGLVHEKQSLDDQRRILNWTRTHARNLGGIAAACGLGRRSPEEAEAALHRSVALVSD